MEKSEQKLLQKKRAIRIKKYLKFLNYVNSEAENSVKNAKVEKLIEDEYQYFQC